MLQFAALAVAACFAASGLAVVGLMRVCPRMLGRIHHVHFASFAGASGAAATAYLRLSDSGAVPTADVALILLCALLAGSAHVDWATAWAPDELTFPICLLAGLAGFGGSGEFLHDTLPALGIGYALFAAARGTWLVQAWLSRTIVPPPDVAGVAMPFLLFDSWILVAANLAVLSLAIGAVRRFPQLAGLAGSHESLALAIGESAHSDCANGIALLGIAFPITVIFLCLENLPGLEWAHAF